MPTKQLCAYLKKLWTKQKGKCYYTDMPMKLAGFPDNECMTVDRINASKGYVKDNIVLCLNIVNRLKQDLTVDELVYWVNLIKRKAG